MQQKIKRVFIANRGEIVARIARACKNLGIESVTVAKYPRAYFYHLVDQIQLVDEEIIDLYLDGDKMIAYAKKSDCQAIHPGFGFLSENGEFAGKVLAAGLLWIGPKPQVILAMGDKSNARIIAEGCQVPCIPGLSQPQGQSVSQWADAVKEFGSKVGYPLLVKAAFGGGGKGMRAVSDAEHLHSAMEMAESEAHSSFGHGELIVEKLVSIPRHIEVQLLGDQDGNILVVGDRDCSLQRRHQKIIEEAPAQDIHPSTRNAIHEAASRLAKTVGYYSAGTVEFILESSSPKKPQAFYFLEMNTRLQVEHPVSEEVFGIDLVAWQIRVAQGESLPENLIGLPRGCAIEARIYAEDVTNDFFPSPGPIHAFIPWQDEHLRWEIGIDGVDEVSERFDPMVAKLISWGPNRAIALQKLVDALERSILIGPKTNIPFLLIVCKGRDFRLNLIHTQFLEKALPEILALMSRCKERSQGLMQALQQVPENAELSGKESVKSLTQRVFAHGPKPEVILGSFWSHRHWGQLPLAGPSYRVRYGSVVSSIGNHIVVRLDLIGKTGDQVFWLIDGIAQEQVPNDMVLFASGKTCDGLEVRAPVPGKIVKIQVCAGDKLLKNQTIMILESMKMEFEVKSPKHGVVDKVLVAEGGKVEADTLLMDWLPG